MFAPPATIGQGKRQRQSRFPESYDHARKRASGGAGKPIPGELLEPYIRDRLGLVRIPQP